MDNPVRKADNVSMGRLLLLVLCLGCQPSMDARFESPQATVDSLFNAYGISGMSESDVIRRLENRQRFTLVDPALHRACFADWRGQHDEGLAGYVFGRLAAAKDHLGVRVDGDRAWVTPAGKTDEQVVLIKVGRAWRISLKQSIPEKVRKQLYQIYRRAKKHETRSAPR